MPGKTTVVCSGCGETISESVIPAKGHREMSNVTKAATCTEDGETTYFCGSCETILRKETVSALGHDYQLKTTKSATCTEEGEQAEVCSSCNDIKSGTVQVIEKLPHTEKVVTEEPTCTKPGKNAVECSVCGTEISSETVSPLGHDPKTVTEPSTCTEHGKEKQICRRCEALLGEKELPLAEHTTITKTEGSIETEKCEVCGEIFKQTNTETGVVYPVALDETSFPDPVFLEYVKKFDEDGDGVLELSECDKVTMINVGGTLDNDGGITSLDGIEIFNNLSILNCSSNEGLTEFDVSANSALTTLWCYNTQINTLDVGNNTELKRLYCHNTQIESLDVSNNTELTELLCSNTQIPFIDISNNQNISTFSISDSKHTIHVVDGVFDLNSIEGFDMSRIVGTIEGMDSNGVISGITEGTNITYTYDCKGTGESKFQKVFTLVPDETSTFAPMGIAIDGENFPDEVFRQYVSDNVDTNTNGYLSQEECDVVTEINVNGSSSSKDGGITLLKGIEYFTELKTLDCRYNSGLTKLDIGNNTALTTLYCSNTQITSLDVSKNMALITLWCNGTQITSLDVSENTALTELRCSNTQITSLDVKNNTALTQLDCTGTKITSLDVSENSMLTELYCGSTPITSLNVRNATLEYLDCDNTQITSLDVSKNIALKSFECHNTQITSLDVSKNIALTRLACYNTQITSLDVSNNTKLRILECDSTQIPFVDISNNTALISLHIYDCKHPIHVVEGTFDLNSIEGFDFTRIVDGTLTGASMDENGVLSGITESTNITYVYDCKGTGESEYQVMFTLVPTMVQPEGVEINAENFPDEKFRTYVSTNFDKDKNGELSQEECEAVAFINVSGKSLTSDGGITSLKGIEFFINLTTLECYYNYELTTLDLSNNTALTYLSCYWTQITSLDVSNCPELTDLYCHNTEIASLNICNSTKLTNLSCFSTQITSLDVSNNTALTYLSCYYTPITSLDLSKNTALEQLDCSVTQIAFVDISSNPEITSFIADGCEHIIHIENGLFDFNDIEGLDISRIVDGTLTGATMDENGVLSGITEGTNITYTYDCKGTGESEFQVEFTLVPDENSTFGLPDKEGYVTINSKNFPDEKFRSYVANNFDTDGDVGYLSQVECNAVTSINVSGLSLRNDGGITSLEGIENFAKLEKLNCEYNSGLTELDVSKNTALKELWCHDTQITSLDVSKNIALTSLNCFDTLIALLDVSKNAKLKQLQCGDTQITSLDVGNNTALTELSCSNTVDVSKNTALITLSCYGPQVTSVDVSKNTALKNLNFSSTQITSFDVSKNTALQTLNCSDTPITSLDVSNNTALRYLWCQDTQITSLNMSKNTALEILHCYNTQITSLDVSKNTALRELDCSNTQITALDISKNTALTSLICNNTQITALDLSQNTALTDLRCYNTQMPFVNISSTNIKYSSGLIVHSNKYPIPADTLQFDITSDPNFAGFDPTRVSDVQGADFSAESGIFDNFTADEITYTYNCKGTGGNTFMKTFTLVRTSEATASLNDDEDTPVYSIIPSGNDDSTTPPDGTGDLPDTHTELPEDFNSPEQILLTIFSVMICAFALKRRRKFNKKQTFRIPRKAAI